MMPRVRRGVLLAKITTSTDPEELKGDLAYQLQVMFQHLQHSTRKSFYPEGWAFAYKDETGAPVNVRQQQDAQEFLQVLCERVERVLLTPEDQLSSGGEVGGSRRPLFKEAFGGQLCDQMIRDDTGGGSSERVRSENVREKTEDFVCLSVDVRGVGGLEASLRKCVEGEIITDFLWEEDQPRVNITKRQCVSRLSESIVFHLKRFELNFDTFMREKVNDEFTFPTTLDMYPFSREGVSGKPVSESENPPGYYQYELGAIVVHSGTTDSGHYFSHIRESAEDAAERCRLLQEVGETITPQTRARQWITFDDSEVSLFSEARIPAECFGGLTTSHDYQVSSQTWTSNKSLNRKSAYMLVYHRIEPLMENTPRPMGGELVAPPSLVRDFQEHILCQRVFSRPHMDFMRSLQVYLLDPNQFVVPVRDGLGIDAAPVCARQLTFAERREVVEAYTLHTQQFVEFLTTHVVRSLYYDLFRDGCQHLVNVLIKLTALGIKSISSSDKPGMPSHPPQSSPAPPSRHGIDAPPVLVQGLSAMSEGDLEMEVEPTLSAAGSASTENAGEECTSEVMWKPRQDVLLAPEVALVVLSSLLRNNGSAIVGILFSPERIVRSAFADLLLQCVFVLYEQSPSQVVTEILALPDSIVKSNVMTPFSQSDIPLIMEGVDSDTGAGVTNERILPLPSPLVELLLLLTRDAMFVQCADQWRRAESFMRILAQISQIHVQIRRFLVCREVVMQLVDLFIGDNSPCNGEVYSPGTRKRAHTSYVSLVYDKNGALPKAAEYLPDWTDLLSTLRSLTLSSFTNAMIRMPSNTPSMAVRRNAEITLDAYSHRCIHSKVLYTHALRQARYVDIINDIIAHNAYEDMTWTNDVAQIIVESISFAANDATGHYFRALESFMSIPDSLVQHRVAIVLDGPGGLLAMLKTCMVNKPTFVCICLFSLFKMAFRLNPVFTSLSATHAKINEWAPWILKFCYQFVEKMRKEEIALEFEQSAKATAPARSTPRKGPFLTIYGESPPECEDTWVQRGNKTFELVQEVLRAMGQVPDLLIPADAFEEYPSGVSTSPIPAIAVPDDVTLLDAVLDKGVGNVNGSSSIAEAALGDAMSDEDFARYLAESSSAASELD